MPPTAVGFRAHTGWAAAVTVAGPPEAPEVIDRRRIELLAPGVPWEVFHAAVRAGGGAKGSALLERATASARVLATAALGELIAELRDRGHKAVACGVTLSTRSEPVTLEEAMKSHTARHAGEGLLYREAIIHAAGVHKLRVLGVPERDLYGSANVATGRSLHALRQMVNELGRDIGPPWTADQKHAALIAWLALASRARKTR